MGEQPNPWDLLQPHGIPRVHYSYRSMHGAFFDCESRSLEEAQRLCEDWLVGQDRCYRN